MRYTRNPLFFAIGVLLCTLIVACGGTASHPSVTSSPVASSTPLTGQVIIQTEWNKFYNINLADGKATPVTTYTPSKACQYTSESKVRNCTVKSPNGVYEAGADQQSSRNWDITFFLTKDNSIFGYFNGSPPQASQSSKSDDYTTWINYTWVPDNHFIVSDYSANLYIVYVRSIGVSEPQQIVVAIPGVQHIRVVGIAK